MSIIELVVLALALVVEPVIVIYQSSSSHKILLSKGLLASFLMSIEVCLFLAIGHFLGGLLSLSVGVDVEVDQGASLRSLYTKTDNAIYVTLMILVALRMLFRNRRLTKFPVAYNLSRWGVISTLPLLFGINVLIAGLALGFRIPQIGFYKLELPFLFVFFLALFWGLMLGRQGVEIRSRRWMLLAALFVVLLAFKALIW